MALLEDDLRLGLDPARLMAAAGLSPDPWQAELLRSGAGRVLLLCCRQAGKSTVTSALALHEALYRAGSLVLMLSPSLRQSGELFRKVLDIRGALGEGAAALPGGPPEAESALRLELSNGSRIISLPGKEATVRGYSGVRLLVIDEAARVPDELYHAVRPMLAVSAGRLIALSTPFGKRGWYHSAWHSGEPWERVRLPAAECPRIPAEFLEAEKRSMPRWFFTQEYECEFSDTDDQLYSSADIFRAADPDLQPLFGGS